ncbi:MAG: peroxiredoxin [Phycisphaerales bacterium]
MPAIAVGDPAPDFEAVDHTGKPVRLSSLRGRPVVVFFYPKDHTPACTIESCGFRDATPELAGLGATVIGISSDSDASHAGFAAKHNLVYSLVSDPEGKLRKLFGVPRSVFGLLPGRVTYVIDGAGVVRLVYNALLRPREHVNRVVEGVRGLTK